MKSSTKLSIAFVLSISLSLSYSLLLLDAQAQVSLEKVNLEDKLIRIQTQAGNPVIDVRLLENTDHCFTDCYAIFKLHPYQDTILPQQPNSEFDWKFEKAKPWMDGLSSHNFEILKTIEYAVDVPDYGTAKVNTTCYDEHNQTYQCEADQTAQTGSHKEMRYRDEYKPFAFWGETLKADSDYIIKLVGKKPISKQANNVDWIPVIKGFELKEWEWWNNTAYPYAFKIISNATTAGVYSMNDTYGICGKIYFFANDSARYGQQYVICNQTDCCGLVAFANTTAQTPWEKESDGSGYLVTTMYSNYNATHAVYHFGEGSGAVVNDSTTNKNNGTTQGSPAWVTGAFGQGLNFSFPSSQYVNLADPASLRLSGGFTILAMVKFTGNHTNHDTVISNPSGAGWPPVLLVRISNAEIDFYRPIRAGFQVNSGSGQAWARGNIVLQDNSWYCIAGVCNGTNVLTYVNGTLDINQSAASVCRPAYGGENWTIGRLRPGDTAYPNAIYDELRYMNRTMSDAEIGDYCNNSLLSLNGLGKLTDFGEMETLCPSDDTYINQNKKFEPANMFCNVNDTNDNGVLIINAPNIVIDCNGMTLNGSDNFGDGIKSLSNGNITIKNCNIQNYGVGIYASSSEKATITNNTLYKNKYGINVYFSSNHNITNNNILLQTFEGLRLREVNGSVISNNNISNTSGTCGSCGVGFTIAWGSHNLVVNNEIKSSKVFDVRIGEYFIAQGQEQQPSINNSFLNTTYDSIDMMDKGELIRQWFLKANVTDRYMNPIQNAQVSVYNKTGNLEWTENTSTNGLTNWNIVTQYIHKNESGTESFLNQTPHTISVSHPNFTTNTTIQNITESKIIHLILTKYNITFNVTSGEDGSSLDNVNIVCNYSGFVQNDTTNTYGPYEFPTGWWGCTFEKINYYNKTVIFTADIDKTTDVIMSYKYHLTNEEHSWIESIYNCLINKNCDVYDLWNATYQLTDNIWNQFKQTNESVVVLENITNRTVSNMSNLTINYSINVPLKENYNFLPIRIFYWFLNESNTTCYNQVKQSDNAETPFCNPLVAQTIGEVNKQLNFTVELRPSLPAGNYTIVRRIDIDPDNVWINYGHERIGVLEVAEENNEPSLNLVTEGFNENSPITKKVSAKNEAEVTSSISKAPQQPEDKSTGMATSQQIDIISYVAVIVSLITLTLVGLVYKNSRKRSPWSF
jgi:parallel beta-helix repeat protein